MTLTEINEKIEQDGWYFDVSLPGRGKIERKLTASALADKHMTPQDYLQGVAQANRSPQLIVSLFTKNGNSYRDKGVWLVDVSHMVGTQDGFSGDSPAITPQNVFNGKSDFLNLQVSYLTQQLEEQQHKRRLAEEENYALKKDNHDLKVKLDTLTEKHDLEMRISEASKENPLKELLKKENLAEIAKIVGSGHHPSAEHIPQGLEGLTGNKLIIGSQILEYVKRQDADTLGMLLTLLEAFENTPSFLSNLYSKVIARMNGADQNDDKQ